MSENRLAQESSPYLLQHKDNPVAWWPWGPEALSEAKRLNRPILLSVGYAACHWCHVMAHESFEDDTTAALMNQHFINIKVDREERPDIDAIYQSALAFLGEQGGWPLTMFLTPDGAPFWGGTYFPPTARYGRPSFRDVLDGIARIFRDSPDKVASNVAALKEALDKHYSGKPGGTLTLSLLDQVALRLLNEVDPVEGGIGGPPKFPNPTALQLLWRAGRRRKEAAYREAVELTLRRMSLSGIYDHLGGGYARYAVDGIWLVPHFEKMLYDNAQLLELLTQAWCVSGDPLFKARVEETVAWTLREMRAAKKAPHVDGRGRPSDNRVPAFAASLDADSEGHEGKFYVWDESEIDAVLGVEAALFKAAYGFEPGGNFEGKTILNRRQHPPQENDPRETRLTACRETLYQLRAQRIWPGWDDKVLADWNGLMIAALVDAALVFQRPDWLAAARGALTFVQQEMMLEGRLRHSWRHSKARHLALLDDLAQVARAALRFHEATGEPTPLAFARELVDCALQHHADSAGGFFTTPDDGEALLLRVKAAQDSATPSGNGTLAEVLARLHYLTGKRAYRDQAEATIAAFAGEVERNFFPLASLLNAWELLAQARQVVIVGQRGEANTEALLQAVWRAAHPLTVLQVTTPAQALPPGHPAADKGQVGQQATAYVCIGPVCSLPLTDPSALMQALG